MASSNNVASGSSVRDTLDKAKCRLQRLKRAFNPALDMLADGAIVICDIRSELNANKAECDALSLRVAEITEDILKRASSSTEMALIYAPLIKPLQDCIVDIQKFLEDEAKPAFEPGLARVTASEAIKVKVLAKDKRLTDVVNTLNVTVTMTMFTNFTLGASNPGSVLGTTPLSTTSQRARAALTITRLPPKPAIFHGRETAVEQIVSSLVQTNPAHIAVLGLGGIGKTSTVLTALHDSKVMEWYGPNRIFLKCESITTADGIVSALAAAVKLPLSQEDDARPLLMQHFEDIKTPVIATLDNLETAWDTADQENVEELLNELSNIGNLSLIITMRGQQRPQGVNWSKPLLPPLDTVDIATSKEIYISNGGSPGDGLDDLLHELDGWPLAIVLMAYQGQARKPDQLLADYREQRTALLRRGRPGHLTSVDVSISLSMNGQSVQEAPGALELLRLLCLLPDGIETSALPEAFPLMSGLQHAERVLEQVSLVTRPIENEIKVLSPIRVFVLSMDPPDGPHLITLQDFLIEAVMKSDRLFGFAGTSEEASAQITKLVIKHFGNMMSVFSSGLHMATVREEILAGIRCLSMFSILMHCGDTFDLLRMGIDAGKRRPAFYDVSGRLIVMQALYSCFRRQTVNPLVLLEEIKQVPQDPALEARVMLVVASRYVQQVVLGPRTGNLVTPEHIQNTLKDARNIFDAQGDASSLALCTEIEGTLALGTGKIQEAITLGAAAMDAFAQQDNEFGMARALHILGTASIASESWEAGEEALRTVLLVYKKYGARQGAATIHRTLGIAYTAQNKWTDALQEYTIAAEGFESIGGLVEATASRRQTAQIRGMMGRLPDALEILSRVVASYETLGDKLQTAGCLLERGAWLDMLGRCEEAVQEDEIALQIFEDLDLEQGIAFCKGSIAGVLTKHALKDVATLDMDVVVFADRFFLESLAVFEQAEELDPTLSILTNANPINLDLAGIRASLKRDSAVLRMVHGCERDNTLGLIEGALAIFTDLQNHLEIAACIFIRACLLRRRAEEGSDLAPEDAAAMEEAYGLLKKLQLPPGSHASLEARRLWMLTSAENILYPEGRT
ncbi:hypothetical protein CALCODRAFT_114593 [Calocera cornea HHB12733]|uniref:TPR-like protein n=1 Tax=Calocera cornea HHB12733 TaxID=1353952 RepID=A0A165CZW3_9BASI|nr:hypothetical protein CALCODRAFT_114593 [Calocera cornea HHB12733]